MVASFSFLDMANRVPSPLYGIVKQCWTGGTAVNFTMMGKGLIPWGSKELSRDGHTQRKIVKYYLIEFGYSQMQGPWCADQGHLRSPGIFRHWHATMISE